MPFALLVCKVPKRAFFLETMLVFGHSTPFVLDLFGLGHLLDVLMGMLLLQKGNH